MFFAILLATLAQSETGPADPCRVFLDGGDRGRKVAFEGWTRNGWKVAEPTSLRGKVKVEPGTRLEVAFALLPDDSGLPPPPLDFTLYLHAPRDGGEGPDGKAPQLSSWQLDASTTYRWLSDVVDLGATPGLAGKEVEFTLAIGPSPAPAPAPATPPGETPSEPPPEPQPFGGWTAWIAEPVVLPAPSEPRPNVVLISLDTLRADHLGCYGYPRRTSPRLDELASEGVRFATDLSVAPWTTPAHMSMLTGLYPSGHHVNEDFDRFGPGEGDGPGYRVLGRDVATIAEILRAAGWRTHALTAGVCVEGWIGFDRGFDTFHSGPFKLQPEVPAEVNAFLERHAPTPFFLFLHTYEVHEPYGRIERARKWLAPEQSEQLKQLLLLHSEDGIGGDEEQAVTKAGLATPEVVTAFYDAGVETADAYVGWVIDRLKALGLWERTLLIVTADHGQELADHDPGQVWGMHGHSLYDELLHVPLIVHAPGIEAPGAVVDGIVQTVDVAPTILELLGVPRPEAMQGESLAELVRHGGRSPREFAVSESTASGQEWKALRVRDHKIVAGYDLASRERSGIPGAAAWEQVFDLAADPREQADLAANDATLLERLRARLIAAFAAITRPIGDQAPGVPLDAEMLRQLRELGYAK